MWGYLLALISGALMSIQGVFNASVTKQTGIWSASGFVQLSAFAVCLAAWFAAGEQGSEIKLLFVTPKYFLLGGVMGAFITYTVIRSVAQLGAARSVMFILIAQLFVSYGIELFGLFGMEKVSFCLRKAIALGVIVAGVVAFEWSK